MRDLRRCVAALEYGARVTGTKKTRKNECHIEQELINRLTAAGLHFYFLYWRGVLFKSVD